MSTEEEMKKYLEKAEVLIEALPYIQRFNRKIIVVKYGGSAMVDEELKRNVIKDVALLKLVGFKPIIVHGGGKEISRWVGKVGKEPRFVNGLRVTDAETMEIAEMVLSKVNKDLVQLVERLGVKAVGISGKDGGLLTVQKKYAGGEDIGFVGEITKVDPRLLYDLLEKDFLPIICPVGLDQEFQTYNVNADDAACAIAKAVQAEKLAFLTDIEGVYEDPKDPSTLISELSVTQAKELMEGGNIGGGMLPKLGNCIDAVENGVSRVHILDGRMAHCLLLEIFTHKGIGTAILNDEGGSAMTEKLEQKEVYIERAESCVLHTYNRYPLVLERGEGVYLYDTDGKKYLDFAAGIAVQALGYHYPGYDEALKSQIDKLTHTSNLYYNRPAMEAAEKLTRASGMSRVFFTNSGTEAIEGAIKTARKYAWLKDGRTDHEIIAMNHSFHGRSMGALSVTGNAKYQEPFKPMIGHIQFADFNDLASVKNLVNEKTCAVILETVQGEGGIYPATEEFLKGVKALCEEHDLLLILDEIQCGMGRTGSLFAWQEYGVQPDVMTCAKALGCGVPVGAFVLGEKAAKASLVPGDHGTTYGGNPFACAAVSTVFDIFERDAVVEHAKAVGAYLAEKLDELVEKYDFIEARRGKGLMQGLVIKGRPVGDIVVKSLEEGLIIITAGSNVLRLVPPLVIEKEQVDECVEKLDRVLKFL